MIFNNLFKKLGSNIGSSSAVIILVILAILLTVNGSSILFMNTPLGRLLLIVLLIFVTCMNKFLGLAFGFILVYLLMVNGNDDYIENFETENNEKEKEKTSDKSETAKINVVTKQSENQTTTNMEDPTKTSENNNIAMEGFDLQSAENTIKRGKESNSIPVDQLIDQSTNENVSPYEKPDFSESFTVI
jgi:predicted membrane protein